MFFRPSTLLAAAAAACTLASTASAAATCNIDQNAFQAADAARACDAIPAHITLTGTTTLLAQSPTNSQVTVFLRQQNTNWSGSGAKAKELCNQIVHDCGGTVGVAMMNGASIATGGAFGGPGVISITV
ncbi:MAG: hypothetical protein LQ342_004316 [Letrouitia transgressa]|nr:MAG: hypothetical protein LQ342_004316 [Letrouitia transgressa]